MSVAGNLGRQSFPVPIGSIFLFAGLVGIPSVAPETYLVCDGSVFDPVRYPLLSVALGGDTLPDLRQKIISGGPEADIGTIVPANAGTITGSSFTLLPNNIPSLAFTASFTSFSTVVTADTGQEPTFLINTILDTATAIDSTPAGQEVQTVTPPVVAPQIINLPFCQYQNPAQTEVTPVVNITAGSTDPAELVFRYIIKAGF